MSTPLVNAIRVYCPECGKELWERLDLDEVKKFNNSVRVTFKYVDVSHSCPPRLPFQSPSQPSQPQDK